MRRLGRVLDAFWFVDGSPTRLAVLRILLGTAALAYFGSRFGYFSRIAGSSPAVFEPVGLARFLSEPVPVWLFQALFAATLLANLAFILGWRFGVTGPLFAGLLLWVLCYRNSWSMIYHTDNLIVLQLLILGLTRSADALSLDALRGRIKGSPGSEGRPGEGRPDEGSWEYGYPVRLLCAVTAVIYVLSGIAKVAGPFGWEWAIGEGLRTQVAFDGLRKELIDEGARPVAFLLYGSLPFWTAIGVGTLVLELGAPLALLSRRLGLLWAAAVFGMHWGIYAIMGITFWYHLIGLAFAPFFVGERLVAWVRAGAARWGQTVATWSVRGTALADAEVPDPPEVAATGATVSRG